MILFSSSRLSITRILYTRHVHMLYGLSECNYCDMFHIVDSHPVLGREGVHFDNGFGFVFNHSSVRLVVSGSYANLLMFIVTEEMYMYSKVLQSMIS